MRKTLILFMLITCTALTQHNDSIINYIFENRLVFENYFPDNTYEQIRLHSLGISPFRRPMLNVWQREGLFTNNVTIEVFYEHSDEIIASIINNRRLTRNPSFWNVVVPLIKEGRATRVFGHEIASVNLLRNVPVDVLVESQGIVSELLNYLIARDSIRWNNEHYRNEFSNRFMGYPLTATLARLHNIRDYQLIPVLESELWDWQRNIINILRRCEKDIEEIQERRFIRASELLEIVGFCNYVTLITRMTAHIERSANMVDNAINIFVNKDFSREELVANFLRDPVRYSWYVRRLADDWVISQIVPFLVYKRSGVFENPRNNTIRDSTDFVYFGPLLTILRELYYDFDLEGKYLSMERSFYDSQFWYDPQRNNNIPFSEVYSENYMDFVRRYEEWIRKRFGVGLNRQPQPSDVIIRGRPVIR